MKYVPLTCVLVFNSWMMWSQTNPEKFLIKFDSLNQIEAIILNDDLSSNLDSLSPELMEEKQRELLDNVDAVAIQKFIAGVWSLQSNTHAGGTASDLQVPDQYIFYKNGRFSSTTPGDSILGKWQIEPSDFSNFRLDFDVPQIGIKDKEILKYLPQEQIQAMTYQSTMLSICYLDKHNLVFSTFLPATSDDPDEDQLFFKLILTRYSKEH